MKLRGAENLARISFLHQAAESIAGTYPGIGMFYGKVMKTISEKTKAKLDFTLKRTLCKACNLPFLTTSGGMMFSYRLRRRKSRGKGSPTQILTCRNCLVTKKFLADRKRPIRAIDPSSR